jgi:hypothetical protein
MPFDADELSDDPLRKRLPLPMRASLAPATLDAPVAARSMTRPSASALDLSPALDLPPGNAVPRDSGAMSLVQPGLRGSGLDLPNVNDPKYNPPSRSGLKAGLETLGVGLLGGYDAARQFWNAPKAEATQRLARDQEAAKLASTTADTEAQARERSEKASLDIALAKKALNAPAAKPESLTQEEADAVEDLVASGTPRVDAIAKVKAAGTTPKGPTAEEDTQRAESIRSDKTLGRPVSKEDEAWLAARTTERTIPATTAETAAQTRQEKQQQFQQQEVGRKYLNEKVEPAYNDSVEKAATLRGLVQGARAGNRVDANMLALVTALTVTTTEGVKRINQPEIGMTREAGSLRDRINSWVGKLKAGDPVPDNLKNDILALADVLEKNAKDKYLKEFGRTKKRYSLDDEEPLTGDGEPSADVNALIQKHARTTTK